jgi:mannosyltransferase OCH1-like enzyme
MTSPMQHDHVPRIIHQAYFRGTTGNVSMPGALRILSSRWRAVLPDWEHRLWTAEDNRDLWVKYHPELLGMYDAYPDPISQADATRLLYMEVLAP